MPARLVLIVFTGKYEIRKVSIERGKLIAKLKREKEVKIIKEILDLQRNNGRQLTSQEVVNLNLLNSQLDKLYEEKTKAAFTRSRHKWIENGEKNTKYFFGLEKRNA